MNQSEKELQPPKNNKLFLVADIRALESLVSKGVISYSRMVELMNVEVNRHTKEAEKKTAIEFADWLNNNWYVPMKDGMWRLEVENIEYTLKKPQINIRKL